MVDVDFRKKEYTAEMRRMKRTIFILVGVFIVLICFSAYVLRIKSTRTDFSVVHFNQGQYKGGFLEDKWPNKPEEDNSLQVKEPGRIYEGHERPNIEVDQSGGRGGGYNHINDNTGDSSRDRTHETRPKPYRPFNELIATPYRRRRPTTSVPTTIDQTLKDTFSNRDSNLENNNVQTQEESTSGTLLNVRSKLKQLAKESGMNVAGLLAKLLGLTGSTDSTSKSTTIPLQETGSAYDNQNPDIKVHNKGDRSWYMYDRNGVKRKFYFSDNPVGGESKDGHRDDFSKNNQNRYHGAYWKESVYDRNGMDKDGYYRNKGSGRDESESDRHHDDTQDREQQFGRRRGHFHRHDQNEPGLGGEYNNTRNEETRGDFQRYNPLAPNTDTSGNRTEQKSANSEQEHAGSGRNASISNANNDDKWSGNLANKQPAVTPQSDRSEDTHSPDSAHDVKVDEQSKESQEPLYATRMMIKKRIQTLLQQQKLAAPGDTSIIQSISLLQATLDSIEGELKNSKQHWRKVDVNNNTGGHISSTSSPTREDHSPQLTTKIHSTPALTSDVHSPSTTTENVTQHPNETTTAKPEYTTTNSPYKPSAVKSYASGYDISPDDIDLQDWQGMNRIVVRIISQLKEDPTKVDVYDLSKHPRSMHECVALRTVSPHAVICINNPRLDKPLSESLKIIGLWENREVEMFKTVLRSNHSYQVIDLGATLGVFSLTAAAMGRWVVAVEPLPLNTAPFHKSVVFNSFPLKHITLVTNAITDYHGIAELVYRPYGNLADVRTSALSLRDLRRFSGNMHDLVRTITLDDLSNVVPFPSAVMKIDIQGDEYVIFKRANKFFDKLDIPYIFMHWIPTENKEGSKFIATFLSERGYRAKSALDNDYLTEDQLLVDHDIIIWIKQQGTAKSEQ